MNKTKMSLRVLALTSGMLLLAGTAHAANYRWTGAASNAWNNSLNWVNTDNLTATGVPGAGDNAVITAQRTVDVATNVTVAQLSLEPESKLQGAGNVTVTNTFNVLDAVLSGTGIINIPAGSVLNFNSVGTRNGLLSGTLNLLGSLVNTVLNILISKTINNSGMVNLNSGNLSFGSNFNNNAGGTFNIKTDGVLAASGLISPIFKNAGTLTKSAGSGMASIDLAFTNSGVVTVQSGTLDLGPNFSQTAGKTSLDGGHLAARGPIKINGGVLGGTGSIKGNVTNGARVAPGHSPGALTINGNYTQTASGILDMEIGGRLAGTQYDQLIVNGDASLAGTLSLVKYNGFLPTDGDNFQLLTYYGLTGQFATTTGLYPGSQRYYTTTYTPSYLVASCWLDAVTPAVSVTTPTPNGSYTSISAAKGSASDGGAGISSVTVMLYRYATAKTTAGYWSGGTTWSTGYSASNERPASGTTNWSLTLPTLTSGQYSVRATATDKVGNTKQSTNTVFWKTAGASSVALSSAAASVAGNNVKLTFTGALDALAASDRTRYSVIVNGVTVAVQSASYTAATNTITLTLPSGTLQAGKSVVANWSNLFDTQGKTLSGKTSTLTAK